MRRSDDPVPEPTDGIKLEDEKSMGRQWGNVSPIRRENKSIQLFADFDGISEPGSQELPARISRVEPLQMSRRMEFRVYQSNIKTG